MRETQLLALLEQHASDTIAPLLASPCRAREIPAALNAYGLESYDDIRLGIRIISDLLMHGVLHHRDSVADLVQPVAALIIAIRNRQEEAR